MSRLGEPYSLLTLGLPVAASSNPCGLRSNSDVKEGRGPRFKIIPLVAGAEAQRAERRRADL